MVHLNSFTVLSTLRSVVSSLNLNIFRSTKVRESYECLNVGIVETRDAAPSAAAAAAAMAAVQAGCIKTIRICIMSKERTPPRPVVGAAHLSCIVAVLQSLNGLCSMKQSPRPRCVTNYRPVLGTWQLVCRQSFWPALHTLTPVCARVLSEFCSRWNFMDGFPTWLCHERCRDIYFVILNLKLFCRALNEVQMRVLHDSNVFLLQIR